MDCREARERVLAAEAGRIDEEARVHVASCPSCGDEIRRHEEVWKLLLSLPAPEPRPGFARGIREKLHRRPNRMLRLAAPLIAPAAALAVIFSPLLHSGRTAPAPIESELGKLSPEDRNLFEALNEGETWELADHLDVVRTIDVVTDVPLEEEK